MSTQRTIEVVADWVGLGGPTRMGQLTATPNRGKEIFAFEYDKSWLSSASRQQLDPSMALYGGPQYPAKSRDNFNVFLDSSPDRWGRVLMRRREAQLARVEQRAERRLLESDYLLGVHDGHRMGALRFRIGDRFLDDNHELASPPWTSLRELEHASLQLEREGVEDDPEYAGWLRLLIAPGGSLGGARPKASVRDEGAQLWIAKFPSRNDEDDIGAWEYVVHELATRAGVTVPEAQLRRFGSRKTGGHGHHTFLSRRFDRTGGKRLHFASAMTLLDRVDEGHLETLVVANVWSASNDSATLSRLRGKAGDPRKGAPKRMHRHSAVASNTHRGIAGLLSIMFAALGCGDDSDSSHSDSDAAVHGSHDPGGKRETTPRSYRVQIEVPDVPPGTEGTKCLKIRLGNDDDIKVGRVHNQLFGQSHHFIVSAVSDSTSEEEPLTDCLPFKAPQIGAPLTVTQKHDEEITLPDGVGYALDKHQLMHLELHYINTTDQTVDIRAESELFPLEEDSKVQEAGFLIAGTMDISIPPRSTQSTGDIYLEVPEVLDGVKYYAVTGHTHRFGKNVSISTAPDHDGEGTEIYALSNFDWSAPEVKYFDPPLQVPAGGGFRVNCSWDNPTDQTIKYGESALTEMCFFWAYYYPKNPKQQTLIHRPGQPK